jgi:hypothetical protein
MIFESLKIFPPEQSFVKSIPGLERREEGRRAVRQQQLDQPHAADSRGQLQRRLREADAAGAVLGAAVDRRAAVQEELGDAVVAAEDGEIQRRPVTDDFVNIFAKKTSTKYVGELGSR